MRLEVIKTEEDYDKAMAIIDKLLRCPEGSPEAKELELLSILVEDYELKYYGKYFEEQS